MPAFAACRVRTDGLTRPSDESPRAGSQNREQTSCESRLDLQSATKALARRQEMISRRSALKHLSCHRRRLRRALARRLAHKLNEGNEFGSQCSRWQLAVVI